MPINYEEDSTTTTAIDRLMAAEAGEASLPKEAFEQTESGELQQSEAAEQVKGDETKPDSLTDDTRATAEIKQPEATDKTQETQKPKVDAKPDAKLNPNGNKPSPFSANGQRLEKKWTAVIARDAELTAKEASLRQQATTLQQQAAKLQLDAAKAKQKFTPEQYEQAASGKVQSADQMILQADGLDKRAEQLEANGEYGKAELAKKQAQDLRDQANGEKYSAKQMKEMADSLRKNPDPTIQQHKATMDQHKRHYLLEAAKTWPDVAKDGSEFQKQMATHLQALAKSGIDPAENPVVFYHVARLTAAETAAARVPKMEKELGAAIAKVKELEKLTAPGGGDGSVQRIKEQKQSLTLEDEGAELRAQLLSQ